MVNEQSRIHLIQCIGFLMKFMEKYASEIKSSSNQMRIVNLP